MTTYIYMRVSSPQNGKGKSRQSTGSQRHALQQYCHSCNIRKPVWYEEYMSGRRDDRKKLQEIMSLIVEGDTLLIWKLDRLGRSMIATVRTLEELMKRKVRVVVTSTGLCFNGSDAMSTFLVQLFSSLAELESSLTSERIRAGLTAARARGSLLGKPVNQRLRNRVKKLRGKGLSIIEIGKKIGRSKQAVSQLLKRIDE